MASLVADLYKELRRLSIAGGELGAGDFRLAKILPQLKSAAEKAPVFGKLAAGVEKITAPETADRSAAILDTAALARAVMCVQAKPEPALGELNPLPETGLDTSADQFSYRVIEPIKEALTTKGSGRRRDAIDEGLKNGAAGDVRLLDDLLQGIDGTDWTIGSLAGQALERIGRPAVPGLLADFKPKSQRNADQNRLMVLGRILGVEGQDLYIWAWSEGSAEVRHRALQCLAFNPKNDAVLKEALAADPTTAKVAAFALVTARRTEMMPLLAEAAADILKQLRSVDFSPKPAEDKTAKKVLGEAGQQLFRFMAFLSALAKMGSALALDLGRAALALESWRGLDIFDMFSLAGLGRFELFSFDSEGTVHGLVLTALTGFEPQAVLAEIRGGLGYPEPDAGLVKIGAKYGYRTLGPAEFYELFRPLLKKGKTEIEKDLIELLTHVVKFGAPDLPMGDPAGKRPLDPRWGLAAAELGFTQLAALMAAPGMPELANFFDKKLAEALKKPGLGHSRFRSAAFFPLMGLVQMGEQASIVMFIKALKEDYFLATFNNAQDGQKERRLSCPGATVELMALVAPASFELLVEVYHNPLVRQMKGQAAILEFIDTFRQNVIIDLGETAEAEFDWKAHGIPLL